MTAVLGRPGPPVLEVDDLRVQLDQPAGAVPILRGVSLRVGPGEVVGLVGESGCGKTMLGLSILSLLPRGMRRLTGRVMLNSRPVEAYETAHLRSRRGTEMVMIFQDAMISLNPVLSVGQQLRDVLRRLRGTGPGETALLVEALERVGLNEPRERLRQYVHQLSGGQRQRILIAMALLGRPSLIIADEPTSALDTSTEFQVLDLLVGAAREAGAAVLLVTHNLGLVADACDRTVVMYAGQVVEDAPTWALFRAPSHPYTRGLLRSVITLETARGSLQPIPGRVPLPKETVPGCRFNPRCELRIQRCLTQEPALQPPDHDRTRLAACWRAAELLEASCA